MTQKRKQTQNDYILNFICISKTTKQTQFYIFFAFSPISTLYFPFLKFWGVGATTPKNLGDLAVAVF